MKKVDELKSAIDNSPMLVFYGFAKLTPKLVRKRSIRIYYENEKVWNEKKNRFINRCMKIVHVRPQTESEMESAKYAKKQWTGFEIFIDEKPYFGNLDRALEYNFVADKNHVLEHERDIIRQKLKKEYYEFYKDAEPAAQQALIFQ